MTVKPKPGDLVCATKSDDSLIEVGSCGVIEGMAGQRKNEFMVTFNPSPLPWWESNAISSSGGPAYWVKATRLRDTGRSTVQKFHKWGPGGPGPDQAVVISKRVHVFEVDLTRKRGGVID